MEIRQITFLRFIAASSVVVFHVGRETPSLAWAESLWRYANSAVSFFFLLSGFVLAYVYGGRGVARPSDFYLARAARILPLYWLALLVVAAYEAYKRSFSPLAGVLNLAMLQAWWPGYSQTLNTPGWSLSVELFFYLSFPFLLKRLQAISDPRKLAAVAVAVWLAGQALYVGLLGSLEQTGGASFNEFVAYHPLMHVSTFVVGAIAGLLFLRHRDSFRHLALPMLLLGTVGLLLILLLPNPLIQYHHNGMLAPLFLLMLWGIACAPHWRLSKLMSAPLPVLLGEASYGVYILQAPVSIVHVPLARRLQLGPDATFWSYYLLLIGVAVACFLWIEAPARARIKSLGAARRGPQVSSSGLPPVTRL